MSADALSIVGLVAVLLPTLYFLIATPTFFLARFEDPIVTRLFRDLLSFHFKLVSLGSVIGMATYALAGRWLPAAGFVLAGVLALAVRRWLLDRLENEMAERDRGDALAIPRMRQLQLRAMGYNALQCVALVSMIPFVFG